MIPESFFKGDRLALSKLLSMIEEEKITFENLNKELNKSKNTAHVIGVTGPPGVGKSTLIGLLMKKARDEGKKVSAILIDPSSPFSGGAILGDRIRMQSLTMDENVFIRSFASRYSKGGFFRKIRMAVKAMEAFGFDYIFVESIGSGQENYEIYEISDTLIVLLSPLGGDEIQAMKSGIMEIGDIFVITKSDLENCEVMKSYVESEIKNREGSWKPKVLCTSSNPPRGIEELYTAIKEHKKYANENRKIKIKLSIMSAMRDIVEEIIENIDSQTMETLVEKILNGENTVLDIANMLIKEGIKNAR